jgi:O-antigen ligase
MKSAFAIVRPSFGAKILFFLLFSGPPKLRLRDPTASLDSTIDWVIVLQIMVWLVAGCWVLLNSSILSSSTSYEHSRFTKLEMISVILFFFLFLSIFFSEAPAFSAFKVYQLIITFAIVTLFAKRYGVPELLNNLFIGCGILAVADIVAAFVMPNLVFVLSELGTIRFRGDLIAQTGTVSVIGLFLLLTSKSDLPKGQFAFWALIFGIVLVFSLTRTSYLAVFVVVLLAAFRRPPIAVLRRAVTLVLMILPLLFGVLLDALNAQRQAEDIWTLSDRLGLWTYLIDVTLQRGPWLGLGYFAASRLYAPEYNPALGTAHSAFMEVYAGGGFISLAVFLAIWIVMAIQITRLYLARPARIGFAVVALFCAAFFLNAIGGELQAEPAGFCFWCVVAALPLLPTERPEQAFVPAQSAAMHGGSC